MDSYSLGLDYIYNQDPSKLKTSKANKFSHKNTISYNRIKVYKANSNLDNELLRTGDRFIPFKNDDNFQNFILKTPNPTINFDLEKTKKNEQILLSPLEEKPETNYASFIVDNMLRTNTDQYNFPRSKFSKFRSNSIYTFSKKISFNSINNNSNSNNNQQKDNNIFFDNFKINNSNNKKSIHNHINNSNELLRTKNKTNKFGKNKNDLSMSSSLLNNQQNQLYQFNSIFNENNGEIPNIDSIFQYIDVSSNKRSVLPDTDYLLANYSYNRTFKRKINLIPERILDAPNLVDDFYLNLLEWGKSNILAVALGPEIYLWNGETSETSLLMSIVKDNNSLLNNNNNENNVICSLSWMNNGIGLGIGLPNGHLEIWDVIKSSRIREIKAHSERVSSLAWNNYILTSGSKDKLIKNFDVRCPDGEISKILLIFCSFHTKEAKKPRNSKGEPHGL